MRYALLSDIHANLPALEAVLADMSARGPLDGVYHLGDLVGYAPWPDEVVTRMQAEGIPGVSGNYDSTVAMGYKHCGCKYEDPRQAELSHESFQWTLEHASKASKHYLGSLPFRLDIRPFGGHLSGPSVRLVHGNHALNTVYVTEDRSDEFLATMGAQLSARAGDVVCFGHTHKPWHRVVDGVHFINTGSVGRPKDGDPRAGYVLLEVAPDQPIDVTFVRVAYDVELAARTIIESALPNEFADFLRRGGA